MFERAREAWAEVLARVRTDDKCVVVVAHEEMLAALACVTLGLPPAALRRFRVDHGSISILDLPKGSGSPPVLRCVNYTSHCESRGGIFSCGGRPGGEVTEGLEIFVVGVPRC